jgi:hypothetical protein
MFPIFQRKPQISILYMSSRRISRNGISISLNTTYTNINGHEKISCTLNKNSINLKKQINMLDDGISNFKTKKNDYFQKIKDEHQKTLQRTNSQYLDLKNLFENIRIEENDKKIREKKEELRKIKKINKNIDLNQTNLNDTFMLSEQNRIKKDYNTRKTEIKNNYNFQEPQLRHSEINKQKKQTYIKNIKRLNTYSNNPNFKNVVNNFKLNKFLK